MARVVHKRLSASADATQVLRVQRRQILALEHRIVAATEAGAMECRIWIFHGQVGSFLGMKTTTLPFLKAFWMFTRRCMGFDPYR